MKFSPFLDTLEIGKIILRLEFYCLKPVLLFKHRVAALKESANLPYHNVMNALILAQSAFGLRFEFEPRGYIGLCMEIALYVCFDISLQLQCLNR